MQSNKTSTKSSKTGHSKTQTIKATKAAVIAKKMPLGEMPVVKRATTAAVKKTPDVEKLVSKPKPVTFKVQSKPGSKVYLAGDFNEWSVMHELTDHDSNGVYQIEIEIEPGVYEYKFHINDTWCVDPENLHFKLNCFGTLNSVIMVD